ncbi:unnamed protein product [Mytilus edulis]|uniref:G-protein coupled receptors family 1 profile domain-containing protein n=1 Tax=Mytilus edulis TaxID=6550 RepID=A0A8S3V888_MYTED|nr:unnamed protein product [Mytilus edulis]
MKVKMTDRNNTNATDKFGGHEKIVQTPFFIALQVISIPGMLGNIVTLFALWRRKKWTSVNLLIVVMAISDCMSLLVILIRSTTVLLHLRVQLLLYVQLYVLEALVTISTSSAIIIGCERAFAVRKPLRFKTLWSTKLTVKLLTATAFVLLLFVGSRAGIEFLKGVDFFKAYAFIPYFIVTRGIPFGIIFATNISMLLGLIANKKKMKMMDMRDLDRQRIQSVVSITITVVSMTTLYFICMIPGRITIGLTYTGLISDVRIVRFIGEFLEVFNYSVTFVIYSVTSKNFRKDYKDLFHSCNCKLCYNPASRESSASNAQQQRL